jgi:hypothetical protein
MIGLLIMFLALSSIAAAAHSFGTSSCPSLPDTDPTASVRMRNSAVVVAALGLMCAMCGAFALSTNYNPFGGLALSTRPNYGAL